MALLKTALLLLICAEVCALTSAFNTDPEQNEPDMLSANGDICKDCTQIFELLIDMLSNTDLQKKMMHGLENLCSYLPGKSAAICKAELEKMFPLAITFLTAAVKPAEVCKVIGLCSSCDKQEKMLQYFVEETLQLTATGDNGKTPPQCSFCLFLVKTLEDLLPKERTESAVTELLGEICHILPPSYRNECKTVITRFGKIIMDALLRYATPQAICTLIHLCHTQEAVLNDPCTLPAYRCRDVKTAIKCGTLFYCHKFSWKPLNYNSL